MSPLILKHLESQSATINLEAVSVLFCFLVGGGDLVLTHLGSKKNQDQSHSDPTFPGEKQPVWPVRTTCMK